MVVIVALLYLKDLHFIKTIFTQNIPDHLDFVALGLFLLGGIITFVIGYLLIFKSSQLAKKICKEDFEISLSVYLNYHKVLEISLIIIGLVVLIFQFSSFLSGISQIATHFFENFPMNDQSLTYGIGAVVQYILGFILVTNSTAISTWIIRINRKNLGEN
ncbi:hypothetical protein BZG02_16700 [Labilibaculum filiforme]|uniref:Uncharacterized protein n=1 Tax=Labilibaculum filiforme TaxID=1940526 RepID=A0A2N3HT90_9BACT|nr:hypothetical protein [Labilibaculum filiforme]PKQ61272.1 hypothetical protein BZG02_16700 [Labilibaculum filiforme]